MSLSDAMKEQIRSDAPDEETAQRVIDEIEQKGFGMMVVDHDRDHDEDDDFQFDFEIGERVVATAASAFAGRVGTVVDRRPCPFGDRFDCRGHYDVDFGKEGQPTHDVVSIRSERLRVFNYPSDTDEPWRGTQPAEGTRRALIYGALLGREVLTAEECLDHADAVEAALLREPDPDDADELEDGPLWRVELDRALGHMRNALSHWLAS